MRNVSSTAIGYVQSGMFSSSECWCTLFASSEFGSLLDLISYVQSNALLSIWFTHSSADLNQALQLVKGEVFVFFWNTECISRSFSLQVHGVIIKLEHMQKTSTTQISKSILILFSNYWVLHFAALVLCKWRIFLDLRCDTIINQIWKVSITWSSLVSHR